MLCGSAVLSGLRSSLSLTPCVWHCRYAADFDRSLASLGYRVPQLLSAAVAAVLIDSKIPGTASGVSLAMDLGCGTGLCGKWIKSHASRVVGVDLSPRMLEIAAVRGRTRGDARHALVDSSSSSLGEGIVLGPRPVDALTEAEAEGGSGDANTQVVAPYYDEVVAADIGSALLGATAHSVDLIVAADVLCYLGDLTRILKAAAHALDKDKGVFAFTVEAMESAAEAEAERNGAARSDGGAGGDSGGDVGDGDDDDGGGGGESLGDDKDGRSGARSAAPSADGSSSSQSCEEGGSGCTEGWRLGVSGRYQHRLSTLVAMARAEGLEMVEYERVVARRTHASADALDVEAHLLVLTPYLAKD